MKVYLLVTKSENESARRLGYETFNRCKDIGRVASKHKDDVIIRWGNSVWMHSDDGLRNIDAKNVINRAKAIRLNCDKHQAIKQLAQVVNVPTIYEKNVPAGVTAVIRKIAHAEGSDFSVVEGPFKVQEGTYGTMFIKTNTEYRVWFCGNKTMCARRVKMQRNEDPGNYPCRSKWGYEFCDKVPEDLHFQTLIASKKIGLDCGAADILFYKNKWHFLELNSAISVDHRVVREFFQKWIPTLIRDKFPHLFEVQQTFVPVVEVRPEPVVAPVTPKTKPVETIRQATPPVVLREQPIRNVTIQPPLKKKTFFGRLGRISLIFGR